MTNQSEEPKVETGYSSTNVLSKECANRLLIWKAAYHQAHTNLKAAEYIWQSQVQKDNFGYFEFEHLGMRHNESAALVAWRSLSEHALILARHPFTTGHAGHGFADNKNDREVAEVRKRIEKSTMSKLGWSEDEYEGFRKQIFSRTNGLLAHYDGTVAEYDERVEGITTMRMVGANLNMPELEKLTAFVTAMEASIQERLLSAE